MMKTPQAILQCEKEYINCIARREETGFGRRYRDALLPDMYDYNFLYIEKELEPEDFCRVVEAELDLCGGRGFCKIVTDAPAPEKVPGNPQVSVLGYYVFDASRFEGLADSARVSVKIVNSGKRAEDAAKLDLKNDGGNWGEDFCRRRSRRQMRIYLSDSPINSYVCYLGEEPVGSCELAVMGKTAKIEDFLVLEEYRRKGYGTAILKDLIGRAMDCGAALIYLVTDEADTAKDMYLKLGFSKVGEKREYLYKF